MARAQYYQAGYTPPAGVNSATGVKEYQRMLGVDVDGIWGPKTQAAYDQYLAGQNTQTSSGKALPARAAQTCLTAITKPS